MERPASQAEHQPAAVAQSEGLVVAQPLGQGEADERHGGHQQPGERARKHLLGR